MVTLRDDKMKRALKHFMHYVGNRPIFGGSPTVENAINKIRLTFDEGEAAYTNFNKIVIGLNFPYFDGVIHKDYHVAETLVGHEAAHIRLTNKGDWVSSTNRFRRDYKFLHTFARDTLNMLEDGRIEYFMAQTSPTLKRGFVYLREKMARNLEETMTKVEQEEDMNRPEVQTSVLRNAILYMVCTWTFPAFVQHPLVRELAEEIYPFVVYSRKKRSTKGAVKATDAIMEIVWEAYGEVEEEEKEGIKNESQTSSSSKGSPDPTEGDDLEDVETFSELSDEEKEVEELLEKISQKAESKLEGQQEDADEEVEKPKEEEKTQEQHGESDGDSADESAEEPSLEKLEEEAAEKEGSKEFVNGMEEMEALREKLREKQASDAEKIEGDWKEAFEEQERKEQEEEEEMKQTFIQKLPDLREISSAYCPSIHDGVEMTFFPPEKMQIYSTEEYTEERVKFDRTIQGAVKEIKRLTEIREVRKKRYQKRGKIDKRSLIRAAAFKDENVMRTREQREKDLSADFMCLMDLSGSNHSGIQGADGEIVPRYEWNRSIAIMLHEVLKQTSMRHAVWGFDSIFGSTETRMFPMVHFDNCFDKEAGKLLKTIGAYEENRDGYSIRRAGEYLYQYGQAPRKVLIVVSDGLPSAAGYTGQVAIDDIRMAVRELRKKGIEVVSIFTGDEGDNAAFAEMYPNEAIYANGETISQMPETLATMLKEKFRQNALQQSV